MLFQDFRHTVSQDPLPVSTADYLVLVDLEPPVDFVMHSGVLYGISGIMFLKHRIAFCYLLKNSRDCH